MRKRVLAGLSKIGDSLRYGEPFFRLELPESASSVGATGVAYDVTGQVYFATELGIQITEANGRLENILNGPDPGGVRDIVFAGSDSKWLYASTGRRLYRRPVKIAGATPFTPVKPPKPPL